MSKYRVWPDGTVQDCDEPAHSHMSDDFQTIEADGENHALLIVSADEELTAANREHMGQIDELKAIVLGVLCDLRDALQPIATTSHEKDVLTIASRLIAEGDE